MRLTNVAQMSLPRGRLHSLALPLHARADRQLPVSFDQGRHVALGDRPGSWMAVAFRMPAGTDRAALAAGWSAVLARHGTLRTVFSRGEDTGFTGGDGIRLHEADVGAGEWVEHPVPGGATREALRAILDDTCRPFGAPSHRLCVVEPDVADPDDGEADRRLAVVIASDHAHVDMWSLLILARDLTAATADAHAPDGERRDAEPAAPIPTFAEHTALLAQAPPAPESVQERWTRIMEDGDGLMPRFPLPLGDLDRPHPEIVDVRDVLDAEGFARFTERADAAGVRVTALALSAIAEATRRVAGAPLRAVFPVHSRFEQRWHDAVGWFITNAVIEVTASDPASCAASIKHALALGSHPLAPILAPYGGMPATPGMFAISWLDTRRIPIAVDPGADVQWVSAAIDTDGVMIWFVAGDDGLHLRCRYPDTPEARRSVGGWIDAVQQGLRAVSLRASSLAPPIA